MNAKGEIDVCIYIQHRRALWENETFELRRNMMLLPVNAIITWRESSKKKKDKTKTRQKHGRQTQK